MILLTAAALAAPQFRWIAPPRQDGDVIVGLVELPPDLDPHDVEVLVDGERHDVALTEAVFPEPLEGASYEIRLPHCGATPATVQILGPEGSHTDGLLASGDVPECAQAEREAPVAPGSLSGLACLLALLGTVGLVGGAVVLRLRRKDAAPETALPSKPVQVETAPAPGPTPSPESPPDVQIDTGPSPSYATSFEPKLREVYLEVVDGELPAGTRWRFQSSQLQVGAVEEDNDVVVQLPQVSGHHARFECFPNGSVYVEDLGSANGTWVDGVRLSPNTRTEVRQGQLIALSSQLTLVVKKA